MGARHTFVCVLVTAIATSRVLYAAPSSEARAKEHFQKGRDALTAGRPEEARREFDESYRLLPDPRSMLGLGAADEQLRRSATAWMELRRGAVDSRAIGHTDWAEGAEQEAARIEPTLPRLAVRPEGDADAGTYMLLDGIPFVQGIDESTPVDPGPHQIRVVAPGKKPWEIRFQASPGVVQRFDVPPLEPDQPVVIEKQSELPLFVPATPDAPPPWTTRRTAALILGFAGLASAAAATGLAISAYSTYQSSCGAMCVGPDKLSAQENAWAKADLASAFAGGAAGAFAGAAILWFWSPGGENRLGLQPSVGVGLVGVRMQREW
jgi:hypothetical protein